MQVQTLQAEWGKMNCEALGNYVCERPYDFNPYWDQVSIPTEQKDIVDYIFETFFEKANCATGNPTDGDGNDTNDNDDDENRCPGSSCNRRKFFLYRRFLLKSI